jgi:hypothetical protein
MVLARWERLTAKFIPRADPGVIRIGWVTGNTNPKREREKC